VIIFCCTEFHRVLHGVTQSFFSPSCYFVIIFCCIELHGVLHGVTQSFFSSFVLLCDNFLLHRVARSFVRCFTELVFPPCYFVIIFCCTEFHRVLHGVTQSFFPPCYFVIIFCYTELHGVLHGVTQSFFPPCYFVIIFCCIELHGVLHGVTQSFFSSFVLLCDNFLLHRVARSFVRCFTELLFPPYYFVIIFCCTEFHRVLHGVTQSYYFLRITL